MQDSERLRFAVLCNGDTFPEWQARCIRQLLAMPAVELALLIIDARPPLPPSSVFKKLRTLLRLKIKLFSLYSRYYVQRVARATRPVDLSAELRGIPRIRCEVIRKGKFSEYFNPEDLAEIRRHDLDFMLRFGFNIVRGEILTAARHGIWSFHHGDEQRYRGAPPGFWEIYRAEPETGAILQRLTETLDGGVVLRKNCFPTIRHSYTANRDAGHFSGTSWPAEVCQDILSGKAGYLEALPSKTSAPIYKEPTNGEMIRFAVKQLGNSLRHRRRP